MRSVIVLALCLLSPFPACARGLNIPWQTYVNGVFGTSVILPQSWRFKNDLSGGAGAVFNSPNGQAEAAIFGSLAAGDDVSLFMTPGQGERIPYRFHKRGVVVVSGYHGDMIFYRKHVPGCQGRVWNNLLITYPAKFKKLFDPVLNKMVFSLKPGRHCF